MPTDTLYPNSDGTKTGWTGVGSTSNLWDNVDEGTVTPTDSNYNTASSNVPLFHGLTNTNVAFHQANSVVVRIRVAVTALKGNNRQFSTVQIVQSDETTALTDAVSIASATASATTLVANLTVTGATDKTTWDAALLKIGALTGTSGGGLVYAIQVEVDYSEGSASNPSVIGLVIGNDTPSVPAEGNIWLLRPPSAYRRFETRFGKPVCPLQAGYRVRRGQHSAPLRVAGQAGLFERRGTIFVPSMVHPNGYGAGRCRGGGPSFRRSDTRR